MSLTINNYYIFTYLALNETVQKVTANCKRDLTEIIIYIIVWEMKNISEGNMKN